MRFFSPITLIIQMILYQEVMSQPKVHWKIYDNNFTSIAEIKAKDVSIQGDFIWYKEGDKFGVMDLHNNVIIKPKYEAIRHYQGGFTSAGIKNCFTMVYNGKEILPMEYDHSFIVDSTGYFMANKGCSDQEEAYIITTSSIHDSSGKLILENGEIDTNNLFKGQIMRGQRSPEVKKVDNGFTIKYIRDNEGYVIKLIYNSKDSLIFSCLRCKISNNINGRFFIHENNSGRQYESYCIDTTGNIRIRDEYNWLRYDQTNDRCLYTKGTEHGLINRNGNAHIIIKTTSPSTMKIASKNRFVLYFQDSLRGEMVALCDSLGNYIISPTVEWLSLVSNHCLMHRTSQGYFFTDLNGKAITEMYDSAFVVPKFNYREMVLGQKLASGWGCGSYVDSPLKYDGFSPTLNVIFKDTYYTVQRSGKEGLFNVNNYNHVNPQYSKIAKVDKNLFAVEENGKWSVIDDKGQMKFSKKNKYINFFGNYILKGE